MKNRPIVPIQIFIAITSTTSMTKATNIKIGKPNSLRQRNQEKTELSVRGRAGWRRVKFGEMAENIGDRVDNPSEAGVQRYVGLEHLDPESLRIRRWGAPDEVEATKLRFRPGDIIFGKRRAYQRKLAVADFEGICSAHAMVLRARNETVIKDFLSFFMQGDVFFERALSISVGSLSPTINWKTLAAQEFLAPPKEEQRRIAKILSSVQDGFDNYRNVAHHLNQLKSALRREVFGQSSGWPMMLLGDLFAVELGKMLSPKARQGISPKPYLGNSNVQWERFDLSEVQTMDFAEVELERFLLKPGDLLVFSFATEGKTYRFGSIRMPLDLWAPWRASEQDETGGLNELRSAVQSMLRPQVVLDILSSFTLFATDKKRMCMSNPYKIIWKSWW